jgi:FAD-dependent oxidoreductase domain-containing protein 1
MATTADVVIVGGGIVGASVAYHLCADGFTGRVLVVDPDLTHARAATPASMGGVRTQYGVASNLALARYGLDFYAKFDDALAGGWGRPRGHFRRGGYLLLAHPSNEAALRKRCAAQQAIGVGVEWLAPEDIRRVVPALTVDGVAGALWTRDDGYVSPRGALQGFVERSRELGATWRQDEVVGLQLEGKHATVHLRGAGPVSTPVVVLAAGAWSRELAGLAGVELPVHPLRRQACLVQLGAPPATPLPMTLDRSVNIAFRSDTETADHLLVSRQLPDEAPGFRFDWDVESFASYIAPRLRRYLPGSGEPRLQRGWAGHYDVSPDENPILGAHPEHPALLIAAGFSGHGLMLAPATGRITSELIRLGRSQTLDARPYRLTRFAEGEPIVDPQI